MLERIILHGFKSFSKRLELEILPGITAFVGPNGCGKSNIGDAIRWALGEQSAKALRSERKIDEVIFHGSNNQKPMKMAEVSLVFRDKNISTSADSKEAIVTRRIFASGESQYLLNNNPCRLKDIQELIYGKGISIKNYSIIPQGKIEQIIDSTGAERRIMIEEASGIIKYKIHKKESLAKLEDAEENLLRVDDILNEIKSNLSSLKRQKSKAQVYKNLKSEKDKIELLLKKSEYMNLNETLYAKNKALEEAKKEAHDLEMKLKLKETEHSQLKTESQQCKEKLDKKILLLSDITSRLNNLEIRYEQLTFQIKELKEQKDRMSSEISLLENNLEKEMDELKSIDTDFILTKKELELKDENLIQLEKELGEIDSTIKTNSVAFSSLQKEILRLQSDVIDHKNRLRMWENDKKNFEKRAESIKNYISNLNNDIAEIKNRLGSISVKSQKNKDILQTLNKHKDSLVSQINDVKRELDEVTANMEASRRAKEISSSRLQSLKELYRNLEGFQEGIK
ncbi:AAA family ATPase, partial [bacterium]|nr:AAA family ATPase [bacterium]